MYSNFTTENTWCGLPVNFQQHRPNVQTNDRLKNRSLLIVNLRLKVPLCSLIQPSFLTSAIGSLDVTFLCSWSSPSLRHLSNTNEHLLICNVISKPTNWGCIEHHSTWAWHGEWWGSGKTCSFLCFLSRCCPELYAEGQPIGWYVGSPKGCLQ